MFAIEKLVKIEGKTEARKTISKCRPGLILVDGALAYTRGDGRAYWVSDGAEVQTKYPTSGPEGEHLKDREGEEIVIEGLI